VSYILPALQVALINLGRWAAILCDGDHRILFPFLSGEQYTVPAHIQILEAPGKIY